jgi:isocitrate dehydrogenase
MAGTPITVAHGDGIGPEIMDATLHILNEAGARLDIETIEVGEKVYQRGISVGIEPSAWESLRRTKVFLKAPITTPQGGGFKSLNVTTRKTLGLYANIRPCVSYHPYVDTKHPKMDLVIVRENEEDLYAGIEHQQTNDVVQCLKLISRPGSEKIVRYAFEYAQRNNRKKVTCFTKDNIMKQTDGLFHKVFDEIGAEYPDLEKEHWIVDIGAAKMADTPEAFDVIVLPNLYGDILSDVAAQIAGSVGLAGSANIGDRCAMFEAIHGSAPRRAGQNLANPSGLLLGAVMMLVHIDQPDVAERVHNAWLRALEDGIHTYDIYKAGVSKQKVGTKEFAEAVVARVGQRPEKFKSVSYSQAPAQTASRRSAPRARMQKAYVGLDVFLDWSNGPAAQLGPELEKLAGDLRLQTISNRGVKVFPGEIPDFVYSDLWNCRCLAADAGGAVTHAQTVALQQRITGAGYDVVKTEGLYTFDGQRGYSLGQGE